jgi:predicted transposase/invertase (TIGR01784 family)
LKFPKESFYLQIVTFTFTIMKDDIHNKHDKIVRDTYSRPEIAKAYFNEFLPPALKEVLDFDSMTILGGTYITEDLKEFFSDLLFQFSLKNGEKNLVVSLLFEHKSKADKYVLVQVGHYIFSQWIKELNNKQSIKPIIPLIYYQDKAPWTVPSLRELFSDYPDSIQQYIPTYDFIFFAINSLTKEQLEDITDAMLLIAISGHDRSVDTKEFINRLNRIASLRKFAPHERNFISLVFVYKFSVHKHSADEIIKMVKTISSPINEDIMSTLDKFIEKGEQIGILKKTIETVIKSYDNGIAIPLIANINSITEEEVIRILKEKGKVVVGD